MVDAKTISHTLLNSCMVQGENSWNIKMFSEYLQTYIYPSVTTTRSNFTSRLCGQIEMPHQAKCFNI